MKNVLTIILGGGKGTRLEPLTTDRAKPACPFGGKYRLVDIPISNSINSGFRRIYVLTQYNTASLHLHIGRTYNFDAFSGDFCEILAAEQTKQSTEWYLGTADAVRRNLHHFRVQKPEYYMILSGDQLYSMNFQEFIQKHISAGMDISIATTPVTRQSADELGILKVDNKNKITNFKEKPGPDTNIDDYKMPEANMSDADRESEKYYLASMGIYIFNAKTMEECLKGNDSDFGKEIIPRAIKKSNVHGYIYRGYWEDIGTIRNFYEANLDLGSISPKFNMYSQNNPLHTHRRDLPPSKFSWSTLENSIASEGTIITGATLRRCLIGIRTIIEGNSDLEGVYVMGADFYETNEERNRNIELGRPNYGIGSGTKIKGAIIDKNVRIGKNCRIGVDQKIREDGVYNDYTIRDGIIIIHKDAIIPDGMEI